MGPPTVAVTVDLNYKSCSLKRIVHNKRCLILSHFSPLILFVLFLFLIFVNSNQIIDNKLPTFNRNSPMINSTKIENISTIDSIISLRHHNRNQPHGLNSTTTITTSTTNIFTPKTLSPNTQPPYYSNNQQSIVSHAQHQPVTIVTTNKASYPSSSKPNLNNRQILNYNSDKSTESEPNDGSEQITATINPWPPSPINYDHIRKHYVRKAALTSASAPSSATAANRNEQRRLLKLNQLKCEQSNFTSQQLQKQAEENKENLEKEINFDLPWSLIASNNLTSFDTSKPRCPTIWDGALCWPETLADTLVNLPCPDYVDGFNPNATAYKSCTESGTWYINKETGSHWTDYRECTPTVADDGQTKGSYDDNDRGRIMDSKLARIKPHIRNFRIISRLGYLISFISLSVAFFILIYVKRLRCPRNSLHLQLFASFIIRSSMYFAKTLLDSQLSSSAVTVKPEDHTNTLLSGYDTGETGALTNFYRNVATSLSEFTENGVDMMDSSEFRDPIQSESLVDPLASIADKGSLPFGLTGQTLMTFPSYYDNPSIDDDSSYSNYWDSLAAHSSTLDCKIFATIWQYSLLANYNWILMEGLYLHNIIFMKIFNDNSNIFNYIVMGWAIPVPFVILWSIMRSVFEDTFCWMTNDNWKIFWVTRAPITVSIILNFIFFINITRVIFLKMFSKTTANPAHNYKYRTWFKSTLILMPLFGDMFFLIVNTFTFNSYDIFEIIWLYTDLSFTTFQGFLVALLYCFLNGEVQFELKKVWTLFKQNYLRDRNRLILSNNDCYQNGNFRNQCRMSGHQETLSQNNQQNNSTLQSTGRTRNSFMSTIDCNSFFCKEQDNCVSSVSADTSSPTVARSTTMHTRPLPTVTIRTATPPINANLNNASLEANMTTATVVQQQSNKVEVTNNQNQSEQNGNGKCKENSENVVENPRYCLKFWCGTNEKNKINDSNNDSGTVCGDTSGDSGQLKSISVINDCNDDPNKKQDINGNDNIEKSTEQSPPEQRHLSDKHHQNVEKTMSEPYQHYQSYHSIVEVIKHTEIGGGGGVNSEKYHQKSHKNNGNGVQQMATP